MKLPLYQGESINPARTPQGSAPADNPFASTFERSAAIATNKLLGIEEAEQDRKEFTLEQNREAQAAEATNQLNNQLIHDLSLPEGHPDSPYDEYGILRSEYADNLKANYGSIADSWGKGFVTEQGMQNAYKAAQQWKAGVNATVDSKLRAGSKARVDRAISNNIETCMTYRNYDAADSANLNAFRRGYKTKDQYLQDQNEINCHRAKFDIDSAPNADALNAWLQSPDNAELLYINPDIRKYAESRINTYLRSQATWAKQQVDIETAQKKIELLDLKKLEAEYKLNPQREEKEELVGSVSAIKPNLQYRETLPSAPVSASPNIQALFFKTGGDFSTPEAKKLSMIALQLEAASINPEDSNEVVYLKSLAENIGLKPADAENALNTYNAKVNKKLTFDFNKAASDITNLTTANAKLYIANIEKNMLAEPEVMADKIQWRKTQQLMANDAMEKTKQEYMAWFTEHQEANSDIQANAFAAIYNKNLRLQQGCDVSYYSSNASLVIKPYLIAAGERAIQEADSENEKRQIRDKVNKLQDDLNKEIDTHIKTIGIDRALAAHPIQAAQMRGVLSAALQRQKDVSFKAKVDRNLSSALPGAKDHYILYIPKSDKPLTNLKYLISYAGNNQPVPIRVIQVEGLQSCVISEKLLKRDQHYGSPITSITFKGDKLSYYKTSYKDVPFAEANKEAAQRMIDLQHAINVDTASKPLMNQTIDDGLSDEQETVDTVNGPDDGLAPSLFPSDDEPTSDGSADFYTQYI